MYTDQLIVSVRRQYTGETLKGARRRLRELRDWSAPVPAAGNSAQQRLESYLLQVLSKGQGRHPLGISEIIPFADRLVLRLESAELASAVLPLLPYRDGRKSRHGVADLRAAARRGGIELVLGRTGSGRVMLVGPRATCDLTSVLTAHQAAVEARRHVPMWAMDVPHDPPRIPGGRRRAARSANRPASGRRTDLHVASPYLASAVLRRLHMWERLNGDGTVTITGQSQAEGNGLAWTVERLLPPGSDLHDDAVAAVLTDPVAGPGLSADISTHHCDHEQCVQTFDSERLTIRTTVGEGTFAARRHTRARVALDVLYERQTGAPSLGEGPGAHVLQLISAESDEWGLEDAAEQLAAAWALQGKLTMVLRDEDRSGKISWRRSRLTGGTGAMFTGKFDPLNDQLKAEINTARSHFDHIIMVKRPWAGTPAYDISPLADDHLVVAGGNFPKSTKTTTVRAGGLERHTVDLSPAESAMAWLHSRVSRLPYADVPMTGLLLQCAREKDGSDCFDNAVDFELARHGMPVLGRLPQTRRLSPRRTVLDHLSDDQRAFVMRQSAQIRRNLGPARADGTAMVAALRQMMER
ncbi:hypothetical protein [Streptomyces sp. PU-14G]|uniref:hypothetical protein n=1 Tax=Streptomyces sp. PU-14G TaxID=2800808 RepID=UPI0034DFA89B